MEKRKARKQKVGGLTGKRKITLIIMLAMMVLMTGGALAQWSALWPVPQQSQPPSAQIEPAAFTAANPTKEMVYINGKLLATEEPAGACSITLSASSQSFADSTPSGGANTGSVAVTANCTWSAVSNASFVTITSGSSGSGNGVVAFTVDNNPLTTIRSATITVSGSGASQIFTVAQGIRFADVPLNHTFYSDIGRLSARGVTLGTGVNEQGQPIFSPENQVPRDQMAVFIMRALGVFTPPTPPPGQQTFTDVPTNYWAYAFIEEINSRAIMQGGVGECGTAGTFCPGASITREWMAAFLLRAKGEFNPPTPPSQRFNDVPPSSPFYNFIDRLAVLQITLGCSTNPPLYCPTGTVTRGQMSAFLVRAFNL
jgi:hypothetical protein